MEDPGHPHCDLWGRVELDTGKEPVLKVLKVGGYQLTRAIPVPHW